MRSSIAFNVVGVVADFTGRRPPPAVVLAGGRGRRLGGVDKALVMLAGRTLLDRVLDRLRGQAGMIALSANGDPARFAAWRLPVLPDPVPGQPGPLAGVLAALRWAADRGTESVMTVPADVPFLPRDCVARLAAAAGDGIAYAASGGRAHPVVAIWPVRIATDIEAALNRGEHRVGRVAADLGAVEVVFARTGQDPFLNLNTPEDLRRALALLRLHQSAS